MRDYNDPEYKKFRNKVRQRDHNKCRWPGCGTSKKLQVHHIRKWHDFPTLRYAQSNGITLCRRHHDIVKNNEESYAPLFIRIVNENHT